MFNAKTQDEVRSQKLAKKLEAFANAKDQKRRFQALHPILSFADKSEAKQFFEENYSSIYATMHEAFTIYENAFKQKALKDKEINQDLEKGMETVLRILEMIFVHLRPLVKDLWQYRSIASIIEKLISEGNIVDWRLRGFRLLLHWISCTGTTTPERSIALFKDVIPLQLLLTLENGNLGNLTNLEDSSEEKRMNRALSTTSIHVPLVPRMNGKPENLLQNNIDFFVAMFKSLELIMSDDTDRGDDITYLFNLIRTHYLSRLYPDIMKKLGILLEDYENRCFKVPPPGIQDIVARFFLKLKETHSRVCSRLSKYVLNDEQNLAIINEIFLHVFRMSYNCEADNFFEHYVFLLYPLNVYFRWIQSSNVVPAAKAHDVAHPPDESELSDSYDDVNISINCSVQGQIRLYIHYASTVFFRKERGLQQNLQLDYCLQVLSFYQTLSVGRTSVTSVPICKMTVKTWSFLQKKLLEIVRCVFSAENFEKHQSKSSKFVLELAKPVLETLFKVWIRSNVVCYNSPELWAAITSCLHELTHWEEVIAEWSHCMKVLGNLMSLHVFKINQRNLPLNQATMRRDRFKNKDNEESAAAAAMSAPDNDESKDKDTSTDPRDKIKKRNESVFSVFNNLEDEGIDWNAERAMFLWKNMITVLGNVNDIISTGLHESAFDTLFSVFSLLTSIQDNQGVYVGETRAAIVKTEIPMFIFISWVFQACEMPDAYRKGRSLAYKLMCQMVARRYYNKPKLNKSILTHFYRLILRGLLHPDFEVLATVIHNCTTLFTLQLPGSSLTLLPFISTIEYLLKDDAKTSISLRKDCIEIICSIIGVCHAYPDLTLPEAKNIKFLKQLGSRMEGRSARPKSFPNSSFTSVRSADDITLDGMGTHSGSEVLRQGGKNRTRSQVVGKDHSVLPFKNKTPKSRNQTLSPTSSKEKEDRGSAISPTSSASSNVKQPTKSPHTTKKLAATRVADANPAISTSNSDSKVGTAAAVSESDMEVTFDDPPPKIAKKTAAEDLKEKIYWILKSASLQDSNNETQALAIGALGSLCFCDSESNPDMPLSDVKYFMDCFAVILALTRDHKPVIYKMAITILDLFSQRFTDLYAREKETFEKASNSPDLLVMTIINDLADSAAELLTLKKSDIDPVIREDKIMTLLSCVLNWTMVVPAFYFDRFNVFSKILLVLDLAIRNDNKQEISLTNLFTSIKSDGNSELESLRILADVERVTKALAIGKRKSYVANPESNPRLVCATVSLKIQTAAKSILFHLLNHFSNFPSFAGVTRMTTKVVEAYDEEESIDELSKKVLEMPEVQFFVYNDYYVVSVVEAPGDPTGDSQTRLLLRDFTGKYAWDCSSLYTETNKVNSNLTISTESVTGTEREQNRRGDAQLKEINSSGANHKGDGSKSKKETLSNTASSRSLQVPSWQTLGSKNYVDFLDSVLSYIGDTSPECLYKDQLLNKPTGPPANMAHIESLARMTLYKQSSMERDYMDECSIKPQPTQVFDQIVPTPPSSPTSSFHFSRLILNQLGFLSWENRKHFHLLEKNEALLRRIKMLDRSGSREYHKIGLVYVGPGQEDEQAIFLNADGSVLYEKFLAAIGWEVELSQHTGFSGLLTENNGRTAVYYATSTMEVIFHVATRMPSEEKKILLKKRHIHNDRVQIIWTEHWRDYRVDIMKTNFKDAIIIIRPLYNGLYHIRIVRGEKVPLFGPLYNNMVVPEIVLAPLVRATAINASRNLTSMVDGFQNYYQQRTTLIDEIVERHKTALTFEDFMRTIVHPDNIPLKNHSSKNLNND